MTGLSLFSLRFWNDHFERKPQRECVYEQVTEVDCECSIYNNFMADTIKYHCDGVVFIWNRIFKEEYNKRN